MKPLDGIIFTWCILVILFVFTLIMACGAPYGSQAQHTLVVLSTAIGAIATILFPILVWLVERVR